MTYEIYEIDASHLSNDIESGSSYIQESIQRSYCSIMPRVYSLGLCVSIECSRVEDYCQEVLSDVILNITDRHETILISWTTQCLSLGLCFFLECP